MKGSMQRVVYATSDLIEWVDVAKIMYEKRNWEPVYWVTTPYNKKHVKEVFPQSICQDYMDATRGIYVEINNFKYDGILDDKIIKQYIFYEKTALKMMDRMDPTAYAFNLSERLELYYEFLYYWINAIETLKPDFVVFSESPHALFQYVLYAVCVEKKIKILRFTPTHIEGLTFLSSAIDETPSYILSAYEVYKKKDNSNSYAVSKRYIEKNRGTYRDAMPYYMKEITGSKGSKQKIFTYAKKAKRFVTNSIITAYKRSSLHNLDSRTTNWDFLQYRIRGFFIKKRLRRVYESLAVSADMKRPYIYVALHYQPEKTTSPEGGIFVDQWLMIMMLSALAPKNWAVYVKEHISQFSGSLYGEQGRNKNFYQKIAKLKNVFLIAVDTNSFDLIDHAQAVATVTGTVGLESVIRSIPVLSFGYAWYQPCYGVFNIKTKEDLARALESIEAGYEVDSMKVDTFLYTIESIAFPGYLNPGNKKGVDIDEKTNIENLSRCLLEYAQKV